MDRSDATPATPPEVVHHYGLYDESERLSDRGFGLLERLRTEQILERVIPPAPGTVVDVGSGPGVYSTWLALRGYDVHALDPVEHHIEQALARASDHGTQLASATVGDARRLDLPSDSADAVLLMGPLYHLQNRSDRLLALTEAHRVAKPGSIVAGAAISRFASALDGLAGAYLDDPKFREVIFQALDTGRHTNPTGDPMYFTTAYFHRVEELAREVADAGFASVEVLAVESMAWLAGDLTERLADPHRRRQLLELADRLSREPTLIGASPHLLAIGTAQ